MFRFPSIYSTVIIIVMLSSAVRALSSSSSRCATAFIGSTGVKPVQPLRYISTRMFSSTTEGGETSIVDTCRDKIQKALETDDVIVKGAFDDPNGSHISIEVVSDLFVGKRAVQRQQLVYKAIWEEMQGPVHVVDAMICKTPDEE